VAAAAERQHYHAARRALALPVLPAASTLNLISFRTENSNPKSGIRNQKPETVNPKTENRQTRTESLLLLSGNIVMLLGVPWLFRCSLPSTLSCQSERERERDRDRERERGKLSKNLEFAKRLFVCV
jgi:hypothetical protein